MKILVFVLAFVVVWHGVGFLAGVLWAGTYLKSFSCARKADFLVLSFWIGPLVICLICISLLVDFYGFIIEYLRGVYDKP